MNTISNECYNHRKLHNKCFPEREALICVMDELNDPTSRYFDYMESVEDWLCKVWQNSINKLIDPPSVDDRLRSYYSLVESSHCSTWDEWQNLMDIINNTEIPF